MDIDLAAQSPQAITNQSGSSNSLHNPDAQAPRTRNRSPWAHKTQRELRKHRNQQRKDTKLRNFYQQALNSDGKPAKRHAAINACVFAGTLSNDIAAKLRAENEQHRMQKVSQRRQPRIKKYRKEQAATKAEQVAKLKALERAVESLELDITGTKKEESRPPTLLLSLAHVSHIIKKPNRAEKAFADLQKYQANLLLIEELSPADQSIEAALLYQDQKVAYLDELQNLRTNPSSMNEGQSNGQSQPVANVSIAEDRSIPPRKLRWTHEQKRLAPCRTEAILQESEPQPPIAEKLTQELRDLMIEQDLYDSQQVADGHAPPHNE
ncbi:MAG: hypothetical protein Q9170_007280 [Blastenia crenularia]